MVTREYVGSQTPQHSNYNVYNPHTVTQSVNQCSLLSRRLHLAAPSQLAITKPHSLIPPSTSSPALLNLLSAPKSSSGYSFVSM